MGQPRRAAGAEQPSSAAEPWQHPSVSRPALISCAGAARVERQQLLPRVQRAQTQRAVKFLRCHSTSLVIVLPATGMAGLCMNSTKHYLVSFTLKHDQDTARI